MTSIEDLRKLERSALSRARRAKKLQDITSLRAEFLGKKGKLGVALRSLSALPKEDRPKAGERINRIKTKIDTALGDAAARIDEAVRAAELEAGKVDLTRPGRRLVPGAPHPLRLAQEQVLSALRVLGFQVAEGPLVEEDWYNFEALNIPEDHPARDMQDTFFVTPRVVLRTHTSNVQIRTMMGQQPPVRVVAPGMVFRHDDVDATHSPVFHQVEGLWVDEQATFADLKGVLRHLCRNLFGPDIELRFRPSFFPFTEPSVEIDVRGSNGQWLEILGAGVVDPAVLEAVGYDPERVQGFAFGLGLERVAMLRWGVPDIRLFYENDVRFLEQFRAPIAGAA